MFILQLTHTPSLTASSWMMSSGDNSTDDGAREEETFHIYILSFAYGLMTLVVVGHLVWRWQWRRINLSRFKSHVPGDKSFYSKRIRERLVVDFGVIKSLCGDPRLISDSCEPSMLGACKDGSTVPTHWYRMKAFDEAADFVSNNLHALGTHPSSSSSHQTLSLPDFLSQLQQQGSLPEGEGQLSGESAGLVEQCCEMYNKARHKDGDFDEPQFNEFSSLLKQLQSMVSSRTVSTTHLRHKKGRSASQSSTHSLLGVKEEPQRIASVGSEIIIGYGRHQHLQEQTSLEPLIAISPDTSFSWEEPSGKSFTKSATATSSSRDTPSRSSLRKPAQLTMELSPLIMDVDPDTPTGAEDNSDLSGVFVASAPSGQRTTAGYVLPETPV